MPSGVPPYVRISRPGLRAGTVWRAAAARRGALPRGGHDAALGEVISELARQALRREQPRSRLRSGVPLLPIKPGAAPATLELVNQMRDALP